MINIIPPHDGEDFDTFFNRAPKNIQDEMVKLKERWKKDFTLIKTEIVRKEIDTDERHHQLILSCAKAFAETSLSRKTGYEFLFTEPLIEFSSEQNGACLFDLLIFSEAKNSAIFIECKSSVGNVRETMNQITRAKEHVIEKIDHLSEIIGCELEDDSIECVLCVPFLESPKITQAVRAQSRKSVSSKKYDPNFVKLWEYMPGSETIRLNGDWEHEDAKLSNILLAGYGNGELRNQYDLPFYFNMHPFRVIKNIMVGYCYVANRLDERNRDPKTIKESDIFQTLMDNASCGMNSDTKEELVLQKLNNVIKYGTCCDLLETIDEERIKLKCQGTKHQTVIRNIEEKYINNWSDYKAEMAAKIETMRDIQQKISRKYPTLSDFSVDGGDLE